MANNQPVLLNVSPQHMMQLGLQLGGLKPTNEKSNEERFRALYGIGAKTASEIFKDIQTEDIGDAKIQKADPTYFLTMLYWARGYGNSHRVCGACKINSRTTFQKHSWAYLSAVQALKETKVSTLIDSKSSHNKLTNDFFYSLLHFKIVWRFEDHEEEHDNPEIIIATIDGIHCQIVEPRTEPSSKWCSHKLNKPSLDYELCIDVYRNKLVSINGPFKAGEHDISVARKPHGILTKIPFGKKILGDKGYRGEPDKITTPNVHDSIIVKRFKARASARHETFNKRIKDFKIIAGPFRSSHEYHKIAFEAVCVLVQYDLENGYPLFSI
jgi:DDE superfamily endonuclease